MLGYLARRLAMTIPTLLLVAITVFALVRLIPGDPVQVMLGDSTDPAQVEQLRRQMGLDQSIPVQFAVQGDVAGLRAGQFVTVLATTDQEKTGFAIPRAALVRSRA